MHYFAIIWFIYFIKTLGDIQTDGSVPQLQIRFQGIVKNILNTLKTIAGRKEKG